SSDVCSSDLAASRGDDVGEEDLNGVDANYRERRRQLAYEVHERMKDGVSDVSAIEDDEDPPREADDQSSAGEAGGAGDEAVGGAVGSQTSRRAGNDGGRDEQPGELEQA